MKTIGMIGGIAWQSTVSYYSIINTEIGKRLGGANAARILLHSVNFADIVVIQQEGRWHDGGIMLGEAGAGLVRAGAEVLVLACNTMHVVADEIERRAGLPLLHIADPLGQAIRRAGIKRVALIGTLYTMQMPAILRNRLETKHGLAVLVPEPADTQAVHEMLYAFQAGGPEAFPPEARARFRAILARLVEAGAEGLILGCTELPLMLTAEDCPLPMFDTATLHAVAAAEAALA